MKRDSYSDQQAHTSFQPQSSQPAIEPTQLSQPVHHSSSTSDVGAKWLNKASGWMADKLQTAQNFVNDSGGTIAPDQILPALKGTVKPALSQADRTNQPLVGVIDAGFGTDEHGGKMVAAIQKENPQAKIWQGGGVGTGGGLESLTEFVDVARATGQRAVANLSFDLTEVHPDGSSSTRAQLTAKEQSALSYARDNGVLVVASSGNQDGAMSALGQASQPSDNLIVVGAASEHDRASYSSYGNGLDLVADVGVAGTSSAAATVTGTIAKLWNTNPGLNSQQVEQMLTTTATDLKTPGWDAETGAGLLNSGAAIALATHTAPEAIVFSGAQLIQQVPGSLGGATWESRNGAVASERSAGFGDWLKDNAHGVLDVAGFIPVVGAVADVANAGLYAAEGDYVNAALSAVAAVPGIGDAAAAVKLANRGLQAVRAANRGAEVAQAANRGIRATQDATAAAVPSRLSPGRAPAPAAHPPAPAAHPPAPSPASSSGLRRPGSDRPAATSEQVRPTSQRIVAPSSASKTGTARRPQEQQSVAVSTGRPSAKPQERKPSVGTGSRPATRRQPDHQPGLGAARKPQPKRPESNPRLSPNGAPHKPRVEQPTGSRATPSSRRNPDQQPTPPRNSGQGRGSEPRGNNPRLSPQSNSGSPQSSSASPDPYSPDRVGSASFQVRGKSVTHSPYVTQDALEKGGFFTYTLRNEKGEVRYVGRTSSDNKNGAQEVFLGRMAKGKHKTLDGNFNEIAEIRIEGHQSNAAANAGAEDVLYTRYQIPGEKVIQTYKQTELEAPHTPRNGKPQKMSGGINEGGRQLLNRTNPLSNKPKRIWNPARYLTTRRPDGKLGGYGKIEAFAKDLW